MLDRRNHAVRDRMAALECPRLHRLFIKAARGIRLSHEGSDVQPSETSEVWTFMRARGGKWLLSAIQQVT
jgi:hypothetical protein